MKRYKVTYYQGDRSRPSHLTQISKSEISDGVGIWFYGDGIKYWQNKIKNDLLNGADKIWCWGNSKNYHFQNWKKEKTQGIKIDFKK